MDKILITSFKDEIATAILNLQDKLNPNKDGYIDKTELPAVLDFFGADDVQKLLKTPDNNSPSIFSNNNEPSPDEKDETINVDKFTKLTDKSNAVLNNEGSAAYELNNNIASDLITASECTPYAAQMKNLYKQRKNMLNQSKDTSGIDNEINALNEAVKEYIKANQKDLTQALLDKDAVKIFKYGKDKSKSGYIIQSFEFKGNNTINKNDNNNDDSVQNNQNENNEDTSIQNEQEPDETNTAGNTDNGAGVDVKYGIEIVTENLHAIGNLEAGSDNSDIQGAVVYNSQLNNGTKLSFTGNFRQTIEKNNNISAAGGAFDLSKNKLSAGAYGSYQYKEADNTSDKTVTIEGFAKYGDSVRAAVGFSRENAYSAYLNYNYAKIKLTGSREFPNNGITLNGGLETEYGVQQLKTNEDLLKSPCINLCAKGGLTFKSTNFNTNILANINVNSSKDLSDDKFVSDVTATLLGNVSTDKFDVTATVTYINSNDYQLAYDNMDYGNAYGERKTSFASSITITPKKLLGDKLTPSMTYNLSNDDKLQHYIGANLAVNL